MTIAQIQTTWKGLVGGDGYSFFYVRSTAASVGPVAPFFDAIKAFFPSQLIWQVNPFWKLIDETNGKMTGVGGGGATPTVQGTGGTAYVPQAGAQVRWETNGFVNGRRIKGRTYLVPLISGQWATGGVLNQTTCNTINAAADAMRNAWTGNMVVWARPLFELDADGNPTEVLKRAGSIHTIQSTVTPTKSVTLNARRDV